MEKLGGIDFQRMLNPEQYTAVTAPDGPMLVLAAAGTGKTRTLVYRVAYLVEQGISPERILLLTFTNRAAGEMIERARELAGPSVGGMWGGTFHHLSNRILRRYAELIGYPNDYTILDRDDSRSLVAECAKACGLEGPHVPNPRVLLDLFGSAANTGNRLEALIQERFDKWDVETGDIVKVLRKYEERKRKISAMDFDDLLFHCARLLRERQDVLGRYQERFLHVLVDEYQDTNPIQADLVDNIGKKNRNVLAVGDDFQSIYSWRGADYRNILSFKDRYPDARICKLETNYRSVPEILKIANACIAGNPEQFQKVLRPTRDAYRKPLHVSVRDGEGQARFVVDTIRQLRRDGYTFSDIAVLYRAHYHAMELQMTLAREQVPYRITSGVRFFEQAHIKDVCSVIRIAANPTDEMAFSRLLQLLPNVGPKTAGKLWRKLGDRFEGANAEQVRAVQESLRPVARPMFADITTVFEKISDGCTGDACAEMIGEFRSVFYERHLAETYENSARRMEDIQELMLHVSKFANIEEFLSDVALLTNLDAETENLANNDGNSLTLSTVHQAKGLEWPAVILIWLAEGMFPSGRSLNEGAGDAEERRLFYVAVTRAKDELYLCVPEIRRTRDGGVNYCVPSRFLTEIPRELVEPVWASPV